MRKFLSFLGVVCLALGFALAPAAPVSADPPAGSNSQADENSQADQAPPPHAQNDDRGRSGSAARAESDDEAGATAGGSSHSNPDGGGLDKPSCEATAEGCQGPAPRDGNNGCGNEAEPKSVRDDDNNGNCGGGRENVSEAESVSAAAAQGAWTGRAGKAVARVLLASAGLGTEVDAADADVGVDAAEDTAAVMGVTAERAGSVEEVDLEDLELVRSGAFRSGGRSLLAMTGMALLTLLALSLLTIGVGRLLQSAEEQAS